MRAGDTPDWSPDGQRILFHDNLDLPDESSNLYTVRPDGTGLRHPAKASRLFLNAASKSSTAALPLRQPPVPMPISPSGAGWHASVGGPMELGVDLAGELVDGLVEQVESTVEDFVATVFEAAGIGDAPGDRAVR